MAAARNANADVTQVGAVDILKHLNRQAEEMEHMKKLAAAGWATDQDNRAVRRRKKRQHGRNI